MINSEDVIQEETKQHKLVRIPDYLYRILINNMDQEKQIHYLM